jgi:AcrR family transcriptional regulator
MTDRSVIEGRPMRRSRTRGSKPRPRRGGDPPRAGRTSRSRSDARERGGRAAGGNPARRQAILAAALEEFTAQGFSAARLDDVAQRAGVAKGTIYLYFRDKEMLFEELIRAVLSPVVGAVELALRDEGPVRPIAEAAIEIFIREVYGTRRKDVIRLVLSEGARFPELAEFYYREVLAHIFQAIRALLARAAAQGELRDDSLTRFPQLVGAPAIVAILWNGLFERFEPLDVRAFMHAQLDLIFKGARQ